MPSAIFQFPPDFYWGCSTSSWQVEGGMVANNWSNWPISTQEQRNDACGWWGNGRWREDFDHAAETGQNVMRISIEWARIQPTREHWNEDALDHYREITRGMISRNILPIITLHHFTDPLWFSALGGWENPESPSLFREYVQKVVSALKPLVHIWVTINEPAVYALSSYIYGVFPPGKHRHYHKAFCVLCHMAEAHAAVYEWIHHEQPNASVGITTSWRGYTPFTHSPLDIVLTKFLRQICNNSFPLALKTGKMRLGLYTQNMLYVRNTMDFIGLNYYTSNEVRFRPGKNCLLHISGAALGDSGDIADEPDGFLKALRWASQFGIPVIVTENGIDDAEDRVRPDYLAGHIHQMWKAYSAGIPVKGYLHWTLTDNFEWERGWSQKFGLCSLDPDHRTRSKRSSAEFYALICKKSALDMADAKKYAPLFWKRIFTDEVKTV